MEKKFKLSQICKACGYIKESYLSEFNAAFGIVSNVNVSCPVCGKGEWELRSLEKPIVNDSILESWIKDAGLQYSPQDEEMTFASIERIPLLLRFVDRDDALLEKKIILLASLCTLLYDNLCSRERNDELDAQREQLTNELKRRKDILKQDVAVIMPYIRKVVWPALEISRNA